MGLQIWIRVCWDPEQQPYQWSCILRHGWDHRLGLGVLGILNDSLANAVADWVMVGVADSDRGVLGILSDNPGNALAFWVTDGVTDLDPGVLGS